MKRKIAILIIGGIIVSCASAMTLKESLDFALKTNPSILASQKKLDAASARLSQAVGAFFPTIQLAGNYGKSYSQPSTVQFTTQTTVETLTFGTDATQTAQGWQASLSQPLFVAALFPGYKIAQASTDLARADLTKTVLDTSFNVTQTYYGVLAAERFVNLSKESKQMADSHLDQVNAMLSAGVTTKADLLRTEVQTANADVALTRANNQLDLAKDAFNNALGRDIEAPVNLSEEEFSTPISSVPEYRSLFSQALDNRPDWQQFLLAKQISEDNLRVAQTGHLPTVMLTGTSGNRITEYPSYGSSVNSWAVTGAATWTLFDGLATTNRIREAAANLEAQKATEEQVKNGIALEVRDAYLSLKSTMDTLVSTKKAVDSATENQKVATQRYNAGVGTNIDVIDAQVALTQAKMSFLQSRFDLEIARAKINKVVGKEVL